MKSILVVAAGLALALASPALADSAKATCSLQPAGDTSEAAKQPCVFSQSQGYVTIQFDDGQVFELSPAEEADAYTDADGEPATRSFDLGEDGLVFTVAQGVISVWW